jgi:signal transduction histidine kinase
VNRFLDQLNDKRMAWLALAILVAVMQASFWWLSAGLQQQPLPKSAVEPYDVRPVLVAPLDRAEAPVRLGAMPAPPIAKDARLPFVPPEALRNACVRGNPGKVARVHFTKEIAPSHGAQALLVLFAADNVVPYVNGTRLAPPRGKFDDRPSRDGRQLWLLDVPEALLQPGTNAVDLIVAHNGCLPILTNAMFGERAILSQVHAKAVEVREDVPRLAIGLTLFVGLAVFLLLPIADDRKLILAFTAMMVTMAARSFYPLWNDWRFDQAGYAAVGAAVAILNGAGFAWFAHVLAARHLRRFEVGLGLLTLAHLAVILWAWWQGHTVVQTYIDTGFLFATALYTGVILILWFRRAPQAALWPLAIFSIYVGMTVWTQIYSWLMIPMTFNPRHLVPYYLAIGLGVLMLYRGYNMYRAAEAARASLAEQVKEKEQEIRASYLRLREQERVNAIQNERQRLISDMHDGVSGQLAGLLIMVRGGGYDAAQLPGRVQAIITDLRLIIDSMDSTGESLSEAMDTFRNRVLARMNVAGVVFEWDDRLPHGTVGLAAEGILQIYRFLQEAIANVLKHAGADRAVISIALADGGAMLDLCVRDNGRGIDADQVGGPGRGLDTMRRRITQLGGTLEIAPAPGGGTAVTARIPLDTAE